jgi:hypothetical protein
LHDGRQPKKWFTAVELDLTTIQRQSRLAHARHERRQRRNLGTRRFVEMIAAAFDSGAGAVAAASQ